MKHKEQRGFTKGKETPHPGFHTVQEKIAKKEGITMSNDGAILANSSRNASASAVKANPALKRVKG